MSAKSVLHPLHDADVDLVYFDRNNRTPECDWEFDDIVRKRFPFAMWEVRNQARMHVVDGSDPYLRRPKGYPTGLRRPPVLPRACRKDDSVFSSAMALKISLTWLRGQYRHFAALQVENNSNPASKRKNGVKDGRR